MSDTLAVILASSGRKVLEMGLVYAKDVVTQGWMEDMKLCFFGPSEVTIATDPDLHELVKVIVEEGSVPRACKWCSDRYGVSDMLEELGCIVEYIGSPVSQAIREGCTPMIW